MRELLENWAHNFSYGCARVHYPASVEQVQEIVRGASKAKALGTRHSFNDIADTDSDLISMVGLDRVLNLDRTNLTISVEAGATYGQLSRHLFAEGFALPNLASLPHISVAGACATATHGSGVGNGSLATSVVELEFVRADGELVRLTRERDGDTFAGAVVHLGALGVVTQLTLQVEPEFSVAQTVYEGLEFSAAEANFEAIMGGAYSVSLFTDWRDSKVRQVWWKHRIGPGDPQSPPPELFGARQATAKVSPIPGGPPENCTDQMGVPGPWHERLPHFRMEFTPSSGEELQTEYFVARHDAVAALNRIFALKDAIAPLIHICEIRSVADDDLWLSPCLGQDSVTIHFTWKKNWGAVSALLPVIEEALAELNARPHWGKLFTLSGGRMKSLYPRLSEFKELMQTYDPKGKFRNEFLERNLG